MKNSIHLLTISGVAALVYTAVNWSIMPVPQRMTGLICMAYALHAWEEFRFPGGFMETVGSNLNYSFSNPRSTELLVFTAIFCVSFVPFIFSHVAWLAMTPMLLGIMEVIAHFGMIRLFKLERFYSSGLISALIMLPISIYSITYVVQNGLMHPVQWLFPILYLFMVMFISQLILLKINGMKLIDFLKTRRAAFARLLQK